ncbi:MAG: hypothetical protein WC617_13095 [Rhodanobacter sp.]|jgi:hypothetical protein
MSGDLKAVYANAGRPQYYFDQIIPGDLFRGQSRADARQGLPVLHPNPGFKRKDGLKVKKGQVHLSHVLELRAFPDCVPEK